MTEQQVRKQVRIEGRVQGVGFRWFTLSAARRDSVVGWVKNLPDGGVLCEAQGAATNVASFVRVVGQGPPHARVDRVTVEEMDVAAQPESEFDVMV